MNTLEGLTNQRRKHVESCRENDDKSHETIASLYSDQSHFIYELMQNADDAGASVVYFHLESEAIRFVHDGGKLFDFDDVESITTVGSSGKQDDVSAIGKFGSGFKSVFAVTKTPSIHSGEFHFRIVDFVVPEVIHPIDVEHDCTVVYLPFDHSSNSKEDVYNSISSSLMSLASESLLFLRNVREVRWCTESEEGRYLCEKDGGESTARLITEGKQAEIREYVVFTKPVLIDGATLGVAVAYLLNADKVKKFVAIRDAKVFVFFPTLVSEGLEFLVHAPYKTPPHRESINFEDEQNKLITDVLATLIADSLLSVKEKGLLSAEFLSLLPIDKDRKGHLYSMAFTKVAKSLRSNSLLPTAQGGFTNSGNALLAREKSLIDLLNDVDCRLLFGLNDWLNADITQDKTRMLWSYLSNTQEILVVDFEKFFKAIDEGFMLTKPDRWVGRFYEILIDHKRSYQKSSSYREKGVLRGKPIMRLEDNSHVCPEADNGNLQVYLPSNRDTEFKTVKNNVLSQNVAARSFLVDLGLEVPNDVAEIREHILPKYKVCRDAHEGADYAQDFKKTLDIWLQTNKDNREAIADLLKNAWFARCVNQHGQISLQKPGSVYFPLKKLREWFGDNDKDKDIYFLDIGITRSKDLRSFLKDIGVMYEVRILGTSKWKIEARGFYEKGVDGFNPEFDIHGLGFALHCVTFRRSLMLWTLLLSHTDKLKGFLEKKIRKHSAYERTEEKTSKCMDTIDGLYWLYDREENLIRSPIELIEVNTLNDAYQRVSGGVEELTRVLGFRLDEDAAFEARNPGKKVISQREYDEWQSTRSPLKQERRWCALVEASETDFVIDETVPAERILEDLSGQYQGRMVENGDLVGDHQEATGSEMDPSRLVPLKDVGDWGEELAKRFLNKKYPECQVVSLNENNSVGRGYDFLIRKDGEEIFYYEIKTKMDEAPQSFQMTGKQWDWAKRLEMDGRGDMYIILLVSNAGQLKPPPKVREIRNPVALWKAGKIHADLIRVRL